MDWFVYILECSDGTLYTGITNNLNRRLDQHKKGEGARYTMGRRPLKLVHKEKQPNRGAASRLELMIKKMPRAEKLKLQEEHDE